MPRYHFDPVDRMNARDGRRLTTAALVLVRQKPGSAKGVMFITIETNEDLAIGLRTPAPHHSRCRHDRVQVEQSDLPTFASRVAREMLDAVPDLKQRNVCRYL
jgi:hypothetical protein